MGLLPSIKLAPRLTPKLVKLIVSGTAVSDGRTFVGIDAVSSRAISEA